MKNYKLSTLLYLSQTVFLVFISILSALFIKHLFILVLLVLVIVLINGLLIKRLISPLNNLIHHTEQALTQQQEWNSFDAESTMEIVQLKVNLHALLENKQAIIKKAMDFTQDQYNHAKQSAIDDAKAVTDLIEQKNEINSVAAATTQMSVSTKQIAQNTRELDEIAHSSYDHTQQCYDIALQTKDDANQLSDSMDRASNIIEDLSKYVSDISKVSSSIREISEQTNLLALNAAIEAARAGNQGRGFAVVADEVRALSQRTQISTSDIDSTLSILQDSTQNAVGIVKGSTDKMHELLEKSDKSTSSLDEINELMKKIGDRTAQISAATTQQALVTEDIACNVERINVFASDLVDVADSSRENFLKWEKRSENMLNIFDKKQLS